MNGGINISFLLKPKIWVDKSINLQESVRQFTSCYYFVLDIKNVLEGSKGAKKYQILTTKNLE